ncbi:hypothetical protein ACJMK2_001887, partial [Sinanodonta woodiana]
TVNLSYDYQVAPDEEVNQLVWVFNDTVDMLFWGSDMQKFITRPVYSNRVSRDGKYGILLHHVIVADSGNYSLHPTIGTDESSTNQTHQLIVVEDINPSCSCELMSDFPTTIKAKRYTVTIQKCTLEINLTSCCTIGGCPKCIELDTTTTRQRDTAEVMNRMYTIDAQPNTFSSSRQPDLGVIIFIAVISTGTIVLIIVMLFIIRGVRVVLSRINEQLPREAVALIPRNNDT